MAARLSFATPVPVTRRAASADEHERMRAGEPHRGVCRPPPAAPERYGHDHRHRTGDDVVDHQPPQHVVVGDVEAAQYARASDHPGHAEGAADERGGALRAWTSR